MTSEQTHQNSNTESERVFLVAAHLRGTKPVLSLEESLEELALLADTAGMEVVGQMTQNMHRIDPATYIGSGKVLEVLEAAKNEDAKANPIRAG